MTFASFILALHSILVIAFTLRILLRGDLSPPARLAWFIVLAFLPFIGSAIYFLFGEIEIGHKAKAGKTTIAEELGDTYIPARGQLENTTKLIAADFRPAFGYAASINGFNPLSGNTARLMGDGEDTLENMIADIDAAQDHVHVLYYIWFDDNTGTAIAQALIRAAKRGVTCRAMADGLGSRGLLRSPLWAAMTEAGVHTAVALPLDQLLRTILTSRFDLRNHRKITIIDGAVTYCGSRNSADPEFRPKAKYAPWVDIMLRFEGPVVAQNQLLFASDWKRATGEDLAQPPAPVNPAKGGFPALVMGDGPTERRGATPQLFATAIACARDHLTLTTPYFVPDATVLDALCAAAHRGVTVTLIFPKKNDSWVVAAASHSFYAKLLEAGCIIHEYTTGLLHAKTLTIDGQVSLIGSSNLDMRSFDLNYENNILLQDAAVTAAICERQAKYLAHSEQVSLMDVKNWSYQRRIWNNVIATIGPIL